MNVTKAVEQAFLIYGLATIISFAVAVIIKGIVLVLEKMYDRKKN